MSNSNKPVVSTQWRVKDLAKREANGAGTGDGNRAGTGGGKQGGDRRRQTGRGQGRQTGRGEPSHQCCMMHKNVNQGGHGPPFSRYYVSHSCLQNPVC